jgi:hypothetical protein
MQYYEISIRNIAAERSFCFSVIVGACVSYMPAIVSFCETSSVWWHSVYTSCCMLFVCSTWHLASWGRSNVNYGRHPNFAPDTTFPLIQRKLISFSVKHSIARGSVWSRQLQTSLHSCWVTMHYVASSRNVPLCRMYPNSPKHYRRSTVLTWGMIN